MRTTAYVILGLLFLVALSLWAFLGLEIYYISAKLGTTVAAGLGLDDPGFGHGLAVTLRELWHPGNLFDLLRGETLVLLGAAVVTVYTWRDVFAIGTAPAKKRAPLVFAVLPLVVGTILAWFALRSSFDALASAGISKPDLVGVAFGNSLAPMLVGGLLTIALTVAYPLLRRKPARATAQEERDSPSA